MGNHKYKKVYKTEQITLLVNLKTGCQSRHFVSQSYLFAAVPGGERFLPPMDFFRRSRNYEASASFCNYSAALRLSARTTPPTLNARIRAQRAHLDLPHGLAGYSFLDLL
jgi:hypothetical protein